MGGICSTDVACCGARQPDSPRGENNLTMARADEDEIKFDCFDDDGNLIFDGKQYDHPDLRPMEKEFLLQFKAALKEKKCTLPQDGWTLVRFLRARGADGARDIEKSVKMYQDTANWRYRFGADYLLHELPIENAEKVKEMYKVGFFNTTKHGHPVYIERMGQHNIDGLFATVGEKGLQQMHVNAFENMLYGKMAACSKKAGKRIVQMCSILDLEGVPASSMMGGKVSKFLTAVMKIDSDNYPEILYKMYIVNAPWIFSSLWSAISNFLDANTVAKISILKDNGFSKLQEQIDVADIPKFLGGQCPSGNWPEKQPGPWNDWEPALPKKAVAQKVPPPQTKKVNEFQTGLAARSGSRGVGGPTSMVKIRFKRNKATDVNAAGDDVKRESGEDDEDSEQPQSNVVRRLAFKDNIVNSIYSA